MADIEEQYDSEMDTKPLTEWKNEPTLRDLKSDLNEAQPEHDTQVSKITGYLDNLNVEGAAKVKAPAGRSKIVPKLIRKQAEWRYAALSEPFLSTDDLFDVAPVTWEDKAGAIQNQTLLNSQFRTAIDKVKFIDEYVRTGVDEGTIICRVAWESEDEEYTDTFPQVEYVVDPESAELHQELAQIKQENPNAYYTDVPEELRTAHDLTVENGKPIRPNITGYAEETRTRTIKNRPTIEVCDYRNVIVDPTSKGDLTRAGFLIYSFESSLSELEKDGKYKNLKKINPSDHSPLGDPDHASDDAYSFTFNDEPRKKIIVYEYWGYWDITGTGIVEPIVAAWVGNQLIRMEKNPFPDKEIPFVIVHYLPKRKETHGEPDGALLEDNQKVLGAVTRGMIDIMGRSANGQQGMRKDALDTVNKRKWRNGEDYEFNQTVDPRQGMYMHTFPEIPNSAQFMLQQQNMEAESLTGVKAYDQGVSGASFGDVAAGVRGALEASSKREMGILRRMSAGLVSIGKKFIAMNAVFMDEEEVVRVTNDDFVKVRRDELAGEYDLKLTISTAEEDEKKAKELSFMLQTLGPSEDPELRKIILTAISRLRKMPLLAHEIESFEPKPDPHQQEMQKLELEEMRAKIGEIKSRTTENHAEAQLDQVKANNTQSDTDRKDLDYVEQESGVTQQRDLQKQGEQAKAQGQTKILEHNLKQSAEQNKELKKYLSGADE
jgi:hypothetical protein